MGEHRANLRAAYGHPDVIVHVDGLDTLAAGLPGYFTDQVRNGVRFAPDQTVQVGWTILKLAINSDGDLTALEPDFTSMPIRWVEGVNHCVRFLAIQRAVCEELGVEADFPSLLQPASAPNPFPEADSFTMTRMQAGPPHAGWVFQTETEDASRLVSLYEASLTNRAIIPFLALPEGSVVRRERDGYAVSVGDREASWLSSDLLAKLGEARAFN